MGFLNKNNFISYNRWTSKSAVFVERLKNGFEKSPFKKSDANWIDEINSVTTQKIY